MKRHEIHDLLRLSSVPGIGPRRMRALVERFGSAQAALRTDAGLLRRVDGMDEKTAEAVRSSADPGFADEQIRAAEKEGVRIMHFWEKGFPELLKRIHDPPVLLFIKGNADALSLPGFAVVGTRSPTLYGRTVARMLCGQMAARGLVVYSGMARGIDTLAHESAMAGGGLTVAVLGSGLDVPYPPENRTLFDRITGQGAVISEYPMHAEPLAPHFPRRNRIISGLSLGTLVVEAGAKSGALITADTALEQDREIFSIPGSIQSEKSRGTHRLIREGAKLVENIDDLLEEFPDLKCRPVRDEPVIPCLTEPEASVWRSLTVEPLHVDRIAANAGISASEALAVLLSLELKDCARQLSGMMFVRQN
ncbi:DNA-processing protein DprA [bacterium]|nr:DNA-processing protein DprA [bacterium]